MSNNIKKDLLSSFEKDLEMFNEQQKNNNNNKYKENINPNYKQDKEKSSIINIEKESKKPITNKYRKIINRTKKKLNNSPLSELIQINKENYNTINNDINLRNTMKINNMPKIIFDFQNINNDNDIAINMHRKSKSITNNIIANRVNIKKKKFPFIKPRRNMTNSSNTKNYKPKIFDNNDIKKMIEINDKDSLLENNINNYKNKKIFNKRKSIPVNQKNHIQKDSIFSNLSKINQKEDFNMSKLYGINGEYFSFYSNLNVSSFRISKKESINSNTDLKNDNNSNINTYNNRTSFNNKYPIYYWLKNINLLNYYDLFIENNIFSFDKLIYKLKNGSFILTKEDFQRIGINKPGHIYRIIIKLEIDSGKIKEDIYDLILYNKKNNNIIYTNSTDLLNDSVYYCVGCCEQKNNNSNSNFISNNKNSNNSKIGEQVKLEKWLNKIGLVKYINNFINNGFDILSYFILQMFSSIKIDENIVKEELEIYNEEDVDIILLKLNKEVKNIFTKLKKNEKRNSKYSNKNEKEIFPNQLNNHTSTLDCTII